MGQTQQGLTRIEWDAPGYRKGRLSPGPAVIGAPLPTKALTGVQGNWNCCDVYMEFDAGWLPAVVTLFAEIDGLAIPIDRKLLSESEYSVDPSTGQVTALVFSVRGHPVTGWSVMIETVTTIAAGGECRFVCWGEDTGEQYPELGARRYDSGALDDRDIIEAAPCHLQQINIYNDSAAVAYLLLFDRTTLPPNATPPSFAAVRVAAGRDRSLTFHKPGWRFETGLVWAASTTPDDLTLAGADFWVSASYISP